MRPTTVSRAGIRAPMVLIGLACLVSACAREAGPSAFNALSVKASMDSLWTKYATAADRRDSTAFGELFTEDGSLVFDGAPTVRGRDAIRSFLRSLYASIDATGMRVSQEDLQVSGAMAVQSGAFEESFIEGGKEKTEFGRFALIAEQDKGGAWRIRRLVALTDSTKE